MRKRVTFAIAVSLVLIGTVAYAPTAGAGVGASQECTSGVTYGSGQEIPILNSPVTLNLEGGPSGDAAQIIVCYSTTPNGDGSPALAGGSLWLSLDNDDFVCREDANTTVGVFCIAGVRSTFIVIAVDPRVQGTRAPTGVVIGVVEAPACVRDIVVILPTGNLGPYDVGVCP